MRYIGIDCSLNSTSICIESNSTNIRKYYLYINLDSKSITKLNKQFSVYLPNENIQILDNKTIINFLNEKYTFNFINRTKKKLPYNTKEQLDIIENNKIIDIVSNDLNIQHNDIIGIEGFSFGSSGKSFIDLIKFNQTLRLHLIKKLNDITQFNVFAPTTIKKIVGNGRFNKTQMLDTLLSSNHSNNTLLNHINLKDSNILFQGKNRKVRKPFDDIVDSFWIVKLLKNKYVC